MVFSLIGLEQPGKIQRGVKAEECSRHLHQLHICLPSKNGNTRLLYRMSLDFMQWIQYIPFIDLVWKQVAAQASDGLKLQGMADCRYLELGRLM